MAAAAVILVGSAGSARAHGGPETTDVITFRQDHEQDVAASTSFGLVLSHDGGATWRWMCEDALAHKWPYVPDYAYAPTGALFATAFDSAVVMRDGCTFDPIGGEMFSTIALAPDHALYMASVGIGDAKIYKSTDDGTTFPIAATAGLVNDWYTSLEIAPTDPDRVYLAGYRIEAGNVRTWQLYRSSDAGVTYAPITSTGLAPNQNSSMRIVGIEPGAPDTVYLRVDQVDDVTLGATLWRSTDAGVTWTQVFRSESPMANVLRANGDLVAATDLGVLQVSHDRGDHWTALAGAPHIFCLVENTAGEVWACTQNDDWQLPSGELRVGDGAGIMKTADLASWSKVLRYQDVLAPVACAAGTIQADTCAAPAMWCPIVNKLRITSDVCIPEEPPPPVEPQTPDPPGCCDGSGGSATPSLLLAGLVAAGLVPARRTRRGARLARG